MHLPTQHLLLAVAALAALPISPVGTSPAAPERKPNVVIFLTDDQGTLDANCYGSADLYTPTIDRLAQSGVRFTQAYAHQVCCPTRALLMTGRYPQRSAVNSWTQGDAKETGKGRNMFLEEVTLAELLQGAGYKTGMFGKWHLGAHLDHGPTRQGFDEYFGNRGGFIDNYNHHFLHGRGFHDLYEGTKEVFAEGEYFPDLVTARALEYIDHHRGDAFFLYVAFNIPHYPEQPDQQFDERYKDLPEPRRSYAKMISTTDDRMGRIIERLEKHGLRDDTIILYFSDNGHSVENASIGVDDHTSGLPKGHYYGANGGGGNTGKWIGNKGTFFEGGIRVPAIISWPGKIPAAAVRGQAVAAQDWFPTIAELCHVPLPEVKLDGKSIVPILQSADAPGHHRVMHWQWQGSWAVRDGDWKLIGREGKPTHLGNLSEPEPEKINHRSDEPEIAERLLGLHDAWLKEVEREYHAQYPNSTKLF